MLHPFIASSEQGLLLPYLSNALKYGGQVDLVADSVHAWIVSDK